jgi:hypothetical protein
MGLVPASGLNGDDKSSVEISIGPILRALCACMYAYTRGRRDHRSLVLADSFAKQIQGTGWGRGWSIGGKGELQSRGERRVERGARSEE